MVIAASKRHTAAAVAAVYVAMTTTVDASALPDRQVSSWKILYAINPKLMPEAAAAMPRAMGTATPAHGTEAGTIPMMVAARRTDSAVPQAASAMKSASALGLHGPTRQFAVT